MDEKTVIAILDGLAKETGAVGLSEVERFTKHQKHQNGDNLQELLDYLRTCIKYQVFDLEATRRENQFLRDLVKE